MPLLFLFASRLASTCGSCFFFSSQIQCCQVLKFPHSRYVMLISRFMQFSLLSPFLRTRVSVLSFTSSSHCFPDHKFKQIIMKRKFSSFSSDPPKGPPTPPPPPLNLKGLRTEAQRQLDRTHKKLFKASPSNLEKISELQLRLKQLTELVGSNASSGPAKANATAELEAMRFDRCGNKQKRARRRHGEDCTCIICLGKKSLDDKKNDLVENLFYYEACIRHSEVTCKVRSRIVFAADTPHLYSR